MQGYRETIQLLNISNKCFAVREIKLTVWREDSVADLRGGAFFGLNMLPILGSVTGFFLSLTDIIVS